MKQRGQITVPVAVEGIASAAGLDRRTVHRLIAEVEAALGSRLGQVRRRIGTLAASGMEADRCAAQVVEYAEAEVLSDDAVRSRLMAALGLGAVGGLVLGIGSGLLATIVGCALIVAAGLVVLGLVRELLRRLELQLEAFGVWP